MFVLKSSTVKVKHCEIGSFRDILVLFFHKKSAGFSVQNSKKHASVMILCKYFLTIFENNYFLGDANRQLGGLSL